MTSKAVVTTAAVRSLIKKNGIDYVDATRRLYPQIAMGISVWQSSDSVYFKAFGENGLATKNFEKFASVLSAQGFSYKEIAGSFEIVKCA